MLSMFRQFIDNQRAARAELPLPLPKARRTARPFGARNARIPESLRMGLVRSSVHRSFLLSKLATKQTSINNNLLGKDMKKTTKKVRQEKRIVRAIAVEDIHPMKKILMGQFLIISGAWALSGLLQLGSIV